MSDVGRILVIQLRELGDTIVTTPMLRQLHRLHPDATIDMVCQSANRQLVEHHPLVSRTFELRRGAGAHEFLGVARQLRGQRYDLIVDSQSLPKTALLSRLAGGRERIGFRRRWLCNRVCYTRPFRSPPCEYSGRNRLMLLQDDRVDLEDLRVEFFVSDEAKLNGMRFRETYFHAPVVAIYGATRFEYRRWGANKLANIADRLADRGYQAFLVYGPGEEHWARQIATAMRHTPLIDYPMPSLPELKEILTGCELFVGNDGGPKHFANAAGIPTVTVMDGVSAVYWTPPNRPDQRAVRLRADVVNDRVAGTVSDADDLTSIHEDEVWHEIEALASLGLINLESRYEHVA